jgi:altronate hydrolase
VSEQNEALTIRLSAADNVVVARRNIAGGTFVAAESVHAVDGAPQGHKLATHPIGLGDPIRKYNQIIGFATKPIAAGEHVHEHNCAVQEFERDYDFCSDVRPVPLLGPGESRSFEGYRRANGRVGTRNYIGVLTSVNCSATVARFIADSFNRSGILDDYPNIDGVVSFVHGTGCGMASSGEGFDNFQRTLWGYASHPNFAGILMIGLGCEVFQIPRLMETYGLNDTDSFQTMTIQANGGTRKSIEAGVARIMAMLPAANACHRETVPASELSLALQCGGSDGYSGITANPALGAAADLLVRNGGTAILSETPEIYGAEHLLTRRAVSREVGEKLIARIHWWEEYTRRNGGEMNNNPSPGNKLGGLTTILEKSLGAAAKGGTMPLNGVYLYGEPIDTKGFVFMDSPGYDPCSITGQVASGANVVCFTTGRGSVFGYKPAPSIKLATNTLMYENMIEDMDINCGPIAEGDVSVADKGAEIFEKVLAVASGAQSKSEELGFGDNEFVPWQIGAVM